MIRALRAILAVACVLAACKSSGRQATPEHPITLGESALTQPNVQYRVVGADVTVTNRGAGARSFLVDNDPNKESHAIYATVEIGVAGETKRVEIDDREPLVWKGYRFAIDPRDFTFGQSQVRIVVDRARP